MTERTDDSTGSHSATSPEAEQALAAARKLAHENLDPTLANLPAEMKPLVHWVVWAFDAQQKKSGECELTKVLYQALPNGVRREARSNDPKTWRTLAEAQRAWAQANGSFDGLGLKMPHGRHGGKVAAR